MKPLTLIFTALLLTLVGVGQRPVNISASAKSSFATAQNNKCISPTDAEKILGQAANFVDGKSDDKNGIERYQCTFTANEKEPKTNKLANLYYLLDDFKTANDAQAEYSRIINANNGLSGQTKLENIGDEAIYHSDDANFSFVMFRKGDKLFRIKINKLTALASKPDLLNICRKIAEKLA